MSSPNRKNNFIRFFIIDVLAIIISINLSFLLRFEFNFSLIQQSILYNSILVLLFTKLVFFYYFGLYKGMWRYTSINDLINISRASSLGSLSGISLYALAFGLSSFPKICIIY